MNSALEDPLDRPDYDPIRHLNELFNESSSLSSLDHLQQHIDLYEAHLDYKLSIPEDLSADDIANLNLIANSPREIAQLTKEVKELRTKVRDTEATIREMTSGIKRLDQTKSNLIQSITVLKRLQMLTTAYSQLQSQVRLRQYKEMIQTLPAVLELMEHFKPYRSINHIALLNRKIGELQTKIIDQIFKDFGSVFESGNTNNNNSNSINNISNGSTVSSSTLVDACRVLDFLPNNSREQLITWYCSVQLKEYRTIFRVTDEAGALENVSRRYAYLKRLLIRHAEESARYFAPEWNITKWVCKAFCDSTRDDMRQLLSQKNIDVQLLLIALQETLEFEQFLNKRFQDSDFSNTLSTVFQEHLNIWVDHQDRLLQSKIQQYKSSGPLAQDEDSQGTEVAAVMPSSMDLFTVYRQLLAQASKLSTGKPFLDLCLLFKKYLNIYSFQVLKASIPNRMVTDDDVKSTCIVLNTADYCFSVITPLETRLIDQIDQPYKEQVNFDNEKEKFLEIVSMAISQLVSRVDRACEHAWRSMVNSNWANLQSVGDQSSYITDLRLAVESETKLILKQINKAVLLRLICDRIVESVTNGFLLTAVKCRPISEVSAEQMLLDLYVLKNIFLGLPKLGSTESQPSSGEKDDAKPSSVFNRHVTTSLGRVETLLKVLLTQSDPAEGLVQNYVYLIGDKNAQNFTKILELKGITSKTNQNRYLELFNSHIKAHENLVDESPILTPLNLSSANTNASQSGLDVSSSGGGSSSAHGSSHLRLSSDFSMSSPHSNRVTSNSGIMIKEGLEKGLERFRDAPSIKLNENFKHIGRFFRRDGNNSGTNSPSR